MKSATIKGETHGSDADQQELLQIDLSKHDALFVESSDDDIRFENLSISSFPFAVTFKLYLAFSDAAYHSLDRVEQACKHTNTVYERNIDMTGLDTYNSLSIYTKLFCFTAPALGIYYYIVSIYDLFPKFELVPNLEFRFFIALFLYSVLVLTLNHGLVELIGSLNRDEFMVNEIISRSDDSEYSRIVVSCGEMHRPSISHLLRKEGWHVDELPSRSTAAQVFSPLREFRYYIWKLRLT